MSNLAKLLKERNTNSGQLVSSEVRDFTALTDMDKLIQEEYVKTVLEGAEPSICVREAIPIFKMEREIVSYIFGGAAGYAHEITKTSDTPTFGRGFDRVDFRAKKIRDYPSAPKELVEDSAFDILEMEVRKSGRRIENTLNKIVIENLISNVSYGVTNCSGQVFEIGQAIELVNGNDFIADTLIATPVFAASIIQEEKWSELVALNLKTFVCGVNASQWTFANQSGIGAILFDSTQFAAIGMRDDIKVNKYDDPIHDLRGAFVTMRFDAKVLRGGAACIFYRA